MASNISSRVLWDTLLSDLCAVDGYLPDGTQLKPASFELDGCLPRGPRQYAAAQLARCLVKKFQDEIDQTAADKAAYDVFHAMNSRCENWAVNENELGPYDEVVVGEFKKLVYDFFNPGGYPLLGLAEILPFVDFGPGSAPGSGSTDFLTKIGASQLTASNPTLISLFDEWVKDQDKRVDCEIARTLSFGSPIVKDAVKISAVPKTRVISRLVKPEPLLNMFFQKGIQKVLEDRLRAFFGIDLSRQPLVNQRLAQIGSKTGAFATIDLSSASDCLSRGLCRWAIPRASCLWLDLTRSRTAVSDRGIVELHMMATMGNAFCFPLQTTIFACVVGAVYRALGLPLTRGSQFVRLYTDIESGDVRSIERIERDPNFGVFGDDIIVLEEAYATTVRLLKALGFIPNMDKSFSRDTGTFRESCGADFFEGVNVRAVYCKSLRTQQDRYALINNLVDWSARHEIKLTRTIQLLLSSVKRVPVPPWENPDSGIRMPLSCAVESARIFRAEGLFGSYLYKRYVPEPHSVRVDTDGDDEVRLDRSPWNGATILLAVLKGHCRRGSVTLRNWNATYRKRVGVAPCWDYLTQDDARYGYQGSWFATAQGYFRT